MPSSSWSSCWPRSACPAPAGFVGEFLVLLGAFQVNTWVGLPGRDRPDPRRGLHALALPPGHLRRAHQGRRCKTHPRSEPARDRGVRAAGAAHPVDGHLSQLVPRSDGAVRSTSWSAATMRRSSSPASPASPRWSTDIG